jgi:hypothetical protein
MKLKEKAKKTHVNVEDYMFSSPQKPEGNLSLSLSHNLFWGYQRWKKKKCV